MTFTIACELDSLRFRVDLHHGRNDYIGARTYKTFAGAMRAGVATGATYLEGQ